MSDLDQTTGKLLSFDENGLQFAWDATSLSNYMKCPKYYEYVNLRGLQSRNKSVHLIFGGLYAAALENYFKHLQEGLTPLEATVEIVRTALIDTWEYEVDDLGNNIPGSGGPWDSMHNTKTRETLIRSIVWYLDHFKDDLAETVILENGKPAVELSFSLPFDNGIVYCGHLDRLVEYGSKLVMDQKTSLSTISANYWKQFMLDNQMSGYTYAGKILFDTQVKGVIIDAAQIAVGFTRFERNVVYRTDEQLDEWYENTMAYIEEAREATAKGHFKRNLQSCSNYGGCEFRDACSASPTHRQRMLRDHFVAGKRWDPLERR